MPTAPWKILVRGHTGGSRGGANSSALGGSVDELLAEVLPVLIRRSLLNDNLLVVVAELVDDVLVLLGKLQVVVGSNALLRNGSSVKLDVKLVFVLVGACPLFVGIVVNVGTI